MFCALGVCGCFPLVVLIVLWWALFCWLNGLWIVGDGLVVICVMGIWLIVVIWFSRAFAYR